MTESALLYLNDDRDTRYTIDVPTTARIEGKPYDAQIKNTSRTGARIITDAPVKVDDRIVISIPDAPLRHAFVRWSDGSTHGIEFDAPLSPDKLNKISTFDASENSTVIAFDGQGGSEGLADSNNEEPEVAKWPRAWRLGILFGLSASSWGVGLLIIQLA